MESTQTTEKSFASGFRERVDLFLYSPLNIVIWAILTVAAFAFSLELVFYSAVAVYAIYVILFSRDIAPLMPHFIFCYIQ